MLEENEWLNLSCGTIIALLKAAVSAVLVHTQVTPFICFCISSCMTLIIDKGGKEETTLITDKGRKGEKERKKTGKNYFYIRDP